MLVLKKGRETFDDLTRRALLKLVFRSFKSNNGSGHELDRARASLTCLGNFDLKMTRRALLKLVFRSLKSNSGSGG